MHAGCYRRWATATGRGLGFAAGGDGQSQRQMRRECESRNPQAANEKQQHRGRVQLDKKRKRRRKEFSGASMRDARDGPVRPPPLAARFVCRGVGLMKTARFLRKNLINNTHTHTTRAFFHGSKRTGESARADGVACALRAVAASSTWRSHVEERRERDSAAASKGE